MKRVSKAIAGGVSAGVAAVGVSLTDGHITITEAGTIAAAVVVGFLGTYFAPANTTP